MSHQTQTKTGDQKQMLRWTASQTSRQRVLCCLSDDRDSRVYKRTPRCGLGDRRLRGTELSICPLWLWQSETTLRLRKDLGGIFLWAEHVVLLNGLASRDIISSFNCPSSRQLLSDCLCGPPEQIVADGLPFLKWKAQTKLNNKLCFDSLPVQERFQDNRPLHGNGAGSWKIHDSHVFGLQRRWHKN